MKDYISGHALLGGGKADEGASVARALADIGIEREQETEPAPSIERMADALYDEAAAHGIRRDGDSVSGEAEWLIRYGIESVGLESPDELRAWLSRVFVAASGHGRLRGLSSVRDYVKKAAALNRGQQ